MNRIRNNKDLWAGLLFLAFALVLGWDALSLPIGTARRMGPGYFPLVLAVTLGLLSLGVLARALRARGDEAPLRIPVREALFVMLGILAFGFAIKPLGFLPAVAIAALVCMLAAPRADLRPLRILGLIGGLMLFCWAVFIVGLRLPVPVVGGF